MKVLVCGGAGYIGAHMCKMLSMHGYEVVVFDNLSTGHKAFIKWGQFFEGDLLNMNDINAVMQEFEFSAVMHFSAKSLVAESVKNPIDYYSTNVIGTLNLLEVMVNHNIKNIIFSSSAAVYGIPEYLPIDEAHVLNPTNPYGKTKAIIESMLADFDVAYGLKSVILRYFNAAGADSESEIGERHEPETHIIPNILKSVIESGKYQFKVFGDDYDTPDGTCYKRLYPC